MSKQTLSTAVVTVTPVIDGDNFPPIIREIGADMAACDLGGAIGECVSALFHIGIMPDQAEFRVKIEPGYQHNSETV